MSQHQEEPASGSSHPSGAHPVPFGDGAGPQLPPPQSGQETPTRPDRSSSGDPYGQGWGQPAGDQSPWSPSPPASGYGPSTAPQTGQSQSWGGAPGTGAPQGYPAGPYGQQPQGPQGAPSANPYPGYPPYQSGPYAQAGGYQAGPGYPQGAAGYPSGYDQQHQQYGAAPGYPPAQQYAAQPPVAGQPLSVADEKLWSTLSHISIPFLGVIGPLVVYLLFKDRGPFVRANAIESLNFSILYTVAQVVCGLLTAVLIGYVLLPIVAIGALVACILAAIAANKGEFYSYPVNWRVIK